MAIIFGDTPITTVGKIKHGDTNITRVYQGATLIWPTSEPPPSGDNDIVLNNVSSVTRRIAIQLTIGGSQVFSQFQTSVNCIGQHFNYTTPAFTGGVVVQVIFTVESASGNPTIPGKMNRVILRDDGFQILNSSTSIPGPLGSITTYNLTPEAGRFYRIMLVYSDDVCGVR